MSKKRIYELAKELNVSSKEVIAAAKKKGIEVGNHMSTIGENEERQVRAAFAPKKAPVEKKAAAFKAEKPAKEHKRESEKVGKKPSDKRSTEKKQAVRPDQGKTSRDQKSVNRTNERHSGNHMDKNKNNNNRRSNQREGQSNDRFGGNDNKKGKFNKKNNRKNNKRNNRNQRDNNKKNAVPQRKNKPLPETLVYTVGMNVAEIAKKIHREPAEIIKKLFMMGVMVNQNQSLDKDTIEILAADYGIKAEEKVEVDVADIDKFFEEEANNTKHSAPRPPVVTIMGHVDHGKTTLLDKLRHTNVTAGEAGGITQHIGAYQVRHNDKIITFLDTPGHAAFTSMRARGADITDITVLVVAADDGVMPQTIEAINHSKAAGVPIIVAVNKIDKPGANPNHVMEQLTEYGLIPEDWGGDTIFVDISAKFGKNLDELLDMILLESEMLELKANPKQHGAGSVIEARLDKGKGSVATLLVQQGTLHVGDPIVVGNTFGRVRTMTDARGHAIKKATPATPVEITGLNEVPQSGDRFVTFDDEKTARAAGEERAKRALMKERSQTTHVTLDNLFDTLKEGDMKEVDVIIKADVQGSVEAIAQSFKKIDVEGVRVNIIHQAVGAINESDVTLAEASNAIIIGFNVRPTPQAKVQADQDKVDIRLHNVIYKAIDEVTTAMKGMLEPVFEEKVTGYVEIRQTYKVSKLGTIGGGYVTDGYIQRDSGVRIIRDGIVIYEGKLASLKRFKDDVKQVKSGFECGLMVEKYNDIKEGDQLEAFIMEEVPQD
ncbi:translation initiation factor IF-2 [Ligilactobacillus ruminis]|uniref:translation initiation factor IF-2 n=3 Tax=Ligilactobacillus ruminis TaxID=1623 RepID=UPI0010818067|nr:translation initiation factor IF-2 [Ligilactobacillus ruminis]MBT9628146.1 translation initiation factor IF-2 [Ligilactobacillus ruminis]MDB7641121.1 translation initiation factor IF-2 [Ligilactobacillus ruminis]MDB7646305.1 translation initiation factor IF-2 [Ligilactobacillus ruminis]MDB7648176.1 translation initiation factor IF-2 [Ligilactobacillus ruminis]MSA20156.1 translation initiation factor IF-2 [Ligilactobacillus ruminis]